MAKNNGGKKQFHKKANQRTSELLTALNHYATQYGQVALVTEDGNVFAWQKHKCENLRSSIERHGDPLGFVCMSDVNDQTHVTYWLLPDAERDYRGEAIETLLVAIEEQVRWIAEDEPDESDINQKFNSLGRCGHCRRCLSLIVSAGGRQIDLGNVCPNCRHELSKAA